MAMTLKIRNLLSQEYLWSEFYEIFPINEFYGDSLLVKILEGYANY